MIDKIYVIKHLWDTDGGFGDAVSQESIVKVCADKEKAEAYVAKWSKPYIYDSPYADLWEHELVIEEVVIDNEVDLDTPPTEWWFNEIDRARRWTEDVLQEKFKFESD